ncbi:MAG: glucoamylase family protein [Acidocella sp.]|nr:glucoamylase family protein [Acidocella sp.]
MTTVVGGPLFMHEMTDGFFDLKDKRDVVGMDYWLTSLYAAKIQKQYAIENPKHFADYGAGFWGLSACDTPDGYQALGFPNSDDDGTITPTSAIATVQFDEAMGRSVANALLQDHTDALGQYGFSNGINPTRKWNGPDVIGIDLGMMMLGIDAVHGGLIHRLLLDDPITQRGMKRMGFHRVPSELGAPPIAASNLEAATKG